MYHCQNIIVVIDIPQLLSVLLVCLSDLMPLPYKIGENRDGTRDECLECCFQRKWGLVGQQGHSPLKNSGPQPYGGQNRSDLEFGPNPCYFKSSGEVVGKTITVLRYT